MTRDLFDSEGPAQELLFGAPRTIRTVYFDPPWMERGGGQVKRGADRHYPLVPTAELPALIRSCPHWDGLADTAHAYQWVTNNFLPDGLWLFEQLGFRYVTNLVWTKDRFGLGQYFRGQHELLLFGVRGDFMPTDGTFSTWIGQGELVRGRHSAKPTETYELIEAASPGDYLEIFARNNRPGWKSWGNDPSLEETCTP